MSVLTWLNLYTNALTGTMPSVVRHPIALTELLHHNMQSTGTIPSEAGGLEALEDFRPWKGSNQSLVVLEARVCKGISTSRLLSE